MPLVKIRQTLEVAGDARQGRNMVVGQDRAVEFDNLVPILAQHLDRERFLAVEVVVERALRHSSRRGDLLHAGRVEASAADEVAALFQESRARFGVGGSSMQYRGPVIF